MRYWKIALVIAVIACLLFVLSGCGAINDAVYKTGNRITGGVDVQTFTYCYVVLDGQEIARGNITQWRDYDNSDVVQVMVNGKYYLTHYSNVVLIADPEQGALSYGDVWWYNVEE